MKIIRYTQIKPESRSDGRRIYSLITHSFLGGNAKIFRVKIPKGVIEKEHFHTNSDEIFIFIKPGQIIIDNILYDFKEGDLVILEKNEKHKITARTDMEIIGIKIPDINDKEVVENETD